MSTPEDPTSRRPDAEPSVALATGRREAPASLWRHRDFLLLWAAQTLSMVGSQITVLAIPLLAAVALEASAFEMGLLAMAAALPAPLVGLVAGVWTDRVRRRPILVAADVGRAVLLGSIPLAAAVDVLTMPSLYAVIALSAVLSVWFDVAHASLLPALVRPEHLVDANSRLELSRSGAMIAGPGLAGLLIQAVSASGAILLDAGSYLVSAGLLMRIRTVEDTPPSSPQATSVWTEAREGWRVVRTDRRLSSMALSLSVFNLFSSMVTALFVLFAVRELAVGAAALGLIFAVGSAGFPVGAVAAGWVARRIGVGPAIIGGALVSDLALLLIPLAGLWPQVAMPVLIVSRVVATLAGPVTAINQLSLRQRLSPAPVLGRVNATMLVLALALSPLGALAAGVLGAVIGLQAAVTVGAVGAQAGFIVLLLSPIRTIGTDPTDPLVA